MKPSIATNLAIGFCFVLASSLACNLQNTQPSGPATDGTDEDGDADCSEAVLGQCLPGQEFLGVFGTVEESDAKAILIDDPEASVAVGSRGWLVSVESSTDWVGSYVYDGDACTVGCGWCQPGQSLCHGGLDDNMYPICPLCVPFDTENLIEQCALWLEACSDGG